MSRPGIRDVAAHAGVAIGTVSTYLNHPGRVSTARAQRVADAIVELGFVPNTTGRQLRLGISNVIGYVAPDASNPHFSDIAQEVERRAAQVGMTVLFAHSHRDAEREAASLAAFEQQQVRGLLVSSFGPVEAQLAAIRERGTPSVLVGRRASSPSQPSVSIDDVSGGRQAAAHLTAQGCHRLVFVGGPLPIQQVAERLAGAREVDEGIEAIELADHSLAAGRAAGLALVARDPAQRPDGIVAANDVVALGILQALVAAGVSVPHDIALVGYDDTLFAEASLIPLTSIRARHADFGATAVDLLLAAIDQGAPTSPHRVFEPELIVRRSSRRADSDPDPDPDPEGEPCGAA